MQYYKPIHRLNTSPPTNIFELYSKYSHLISEINTQKKETCQSRSTSCSSISTITANVSYPATPCNSPANSNISSTDSYLYIDDVDDLTITSDTLSYYLILSTCAGDNK